MDSTATVSQQLWQPLEVHPAVGAMRSMVLAKLGLRRVVDVLFFFPRSYEEVAPLQAADQFVDRARLALVGTVVEVSERVTQSGRMMLGVLLAVDGGVAVRLVWFNQPFRKKDVWVGQRLVAAGVLRTTGLNWEMVQPQITPLVAEQTPPAVEPQPIYPLTEGLKQPYLRWLVRSVALPLVEAVEEVLPPTLRQRLNVLDVHTALRDIHQPASMEAAQAAQRRFKTQELLVLQLAISWRRRERELGASAPACEPTGKIHARILNRIGFELTPDQQRAVEEVGRDLGRTLPMNRLLQGDVGSGKTVVAMYAMLLCAAYGHQAALMAPTEVLAQQHASTLQKSLAASRVRIGLLTGSLSRSERTPLLEQVAAGEIDLLVGTQALLSSDVRFNNLGLVIVDEQHKFGVIQRAKLRTETSQPHYLVLSATPIPRTIAMTAFGDLDVSTIRHKPPGRAPVNTYVTSGERLADWWQFVDAQIGAGRQAYVIAPRVAETADSETASAEGSYQLLRTGPLSHRRIGLLHGRLDSQHKEGVLADFASGKLDVLVATTVVEVGIDVPNATLMTILDANRLGLSQLHQLRGRVARGTFAGYVCAIPSAGCDPSDSRRLTAFESSDDGFELAELDLQLRGPGDVLGTSQSGLPPLRCANLMSDAPLLVLARDVAKEILQDDPQLSAPELAKLRQQTIKRYGHVLELSDVG